MRVDKLIAKLQRFPADGKVTVQEDQVHVDYRLLIPGPCRRGPNDAPWCERHAALMVETLEICVLAWDGQLGPKHTDEVLPLIDYVP